MSRRGAPKGRKPPGTEFTWDADPGGEPDTAPTPMFPKYTVPLARKLNPAEQSQVDYYRHLREGFHEGPYYSVLDASSTSAKKGSVARVNFDPFHGMPTYSGRYQKKRRTIPKIAGRSYVLKFFPRELWPTIQPNFRPDENAYQVSATGMKRGFEDEEDEGRPAKDTSLDDEEGEEGDEKSDETPLFDEEDEQDDELVDDDFSEDDDEMGGDYNAEQYFDDGEDDMGDDDAGGGGDDDF
ncbi:uncharacterized protein N7515_000821 [Penicillium bovifimosum]|uniref:DNA-directed RNA polymerase III subunit n=1 Tax=Penicillium bovifimosum TaxID=126998 RepID=A0A9W9HG44_9EURO|nr:uncharacterized protein N7515_000821 [Penicillium bovifimosum]KAJ5146257.1 hypothetical protein N7515_000821 [Penicillium bovifimosum]